MHPQLDTIGNDLESQPPYKFCEDHLQRMFVLFLQSLVILQLDGKEEDWHKARYAAKVWSKKAKQPEARLLQILLGSQTAFGEKLQTIGLTGAVIGTKIKIMQLEIRERGRLYLLFCEKDLREGCHWDISVSQLGWWWWWWRWWWWCLHLVEVSLLPFAYHHHLSLSFPCIWSRSFISSRASKGTKTSLLYCCFTKDNPHKKYCN